MQCSPFINQTVALLWQQYECTYNPANAFSTYTGETDFPRSIMAVPAQTDLDQEKLKSFTLLWENNEFHLRFVQYESYLYEFTKRRAQATRLLGHVGTELDTSSCSNLTF